MEPITATLTQFIQSNFLYGLSNGDFSEDTSFLESGIIDSTGLLELITFVENTYGIRLNDDELIPANLDSVRKLQDFIERKTLSPVLEPVL